METHAGNAAQRIHRAFCPENDIKKLSAESTPVIEYFNPVNQSETPMYRFPGQRYILGNTILTNEPQETERDSDVYRTVAGRGERNEADGIKISCGTLFSALHDIIPPTYGLRMETDIIPIYISCWNYSRAR